MRPISGAWFAGGVGIGVGTMYLFGTRGGRRLRRRAYRRIEEFGSRLSDASRDIKDRGADLLERSKEYTRCAVRS